MEIFSQDGLDSQSFQRHQVDFRPRPGMKYRVYSWSGLCRGLYVAGRIVKPYKTRAQQREKNLAYMKARMPHYKQIAQALSKLRITH